MPVNVHPDYVIAEREFLEADSLDAKIEALNKMISKAPGHKGAENLRQQLNTRRKKLLEKKEKNKKSGKSTQKGIKKEDNQVIIIGKTNSGKSSLLTLLTNANPKINSSEFTTIEPIIGIMKYEKVPIQLIENPAIDSPYYDKGIIHSADTLIILINNFEEISEIMEKLNKTKAKIIIAFNSKEILSDSEKRKLSAKLQSKRHNFVLISTITSEGLEELKEKIFQSFDNIRIFTKEPNKKEKSPRPIIMKPNSTVKDIAEKILKGFSEKIKETKVWGPSSKFPGQKVGLNHKLKDLDVVEFKTK